MNKIKYGKNSVTFSVNVMKPEWFGFTFFEDVNQFKKTLFKIPCGNYITALNCWSDKVFADEYPECKDKKDINIDDLDRSLLIKKPNQKSFCVKMKTKWDEEKKEFTLLIPSQRISGDGIDIKDSYTLKNINSILNNYERWEITIRATKNNNENFSYKFPLNYEVQHINLSKKRSKPKYVPRKSLKDFKSSSSLEF